MGLGGTGTEQGMCGCEWKWVCGCVWLYRLKVLYTDVGTCAYVCVRLGGAGALLECWSM